MSTTFHLSSAKEVTNELIETIKFAYKNKSISITIEEEDYILMWQKEEVLRRKEFAKNNPESLIDLKESNRNLKNLKWCLTNNF